MREGLLDLLLTNPDELIREVKIGGSPGCSGINDPEGYGKE